MTGGIAQAYYKHVADYIAKKVRELLDEHLLAIMDEFIAKFGV
jgi:ADP-ribosylglycohydrolase